VHAGDLDIPFAAVEAAGVEVVEENDFPGAEGDTTFAAVGRGVGAAGCGK
jgi:hypothetical protein